MNATPPSKKAALPTWARALRLRRVELGKSQERVALDSGILNQTTVSELEGAKYEVGNLTTARIAGLARGLEWTLAEMEQALGIDFGLSGMDNPSPTAAPHPASAAAQGYDVPDTPPEIPESLLEAARLYGDTPTFAGLRDPRWQNFLADLPYKNGPRTPEAWLAAFVEAQGKYEPR